MNNQFMNGYLLSLCYISNLVYICQSLWYQRRKGDDSWSEQFSLRWKQLNDTTVDDTRRNILFTQKEDNSCYQVI